MTLPRLVLRDLAVSAVRYDDAPPGLPDKAILLSGSERKLLSCPRKYLLSVIEGLKPAVESAPATYGIMYHRAKEVVHRAWLEDRAPLPADVKAAVDAVKADLRKLAANNAIDPSDALDIAERVEDNIDAWMYATGGGQPPLSYKLVGSEIGLAMPILGPDGKPYAPEMYIVEDDAHPGRYRLARTGEVGHKVRWPFYFIGRLDMLFQHRATGALYVSDDKTSKSPEALIRSLTQDPQVPGYLSLVSYAVRNGLIPGVQRDAPVIGFWHRVTNSSGFTAPKENKETKAGRVFSKDKRLRTLSYRYRQALVDAGLDPAEPEYAEHITHLRANVDETIERMDFTDYGAEQLRRFDRELYGSARQVAELWRAAYRAKSLDDLDRTHPRQACTAQMMGGFCGFVGPCMNDGVQVRQDFKQQPWQTWAPRVATPPGPATSPPAGTPADPTPSDSTLTPGTTPTLDLEF